MSDRIPAEVFPLAEHLCDEMQSRGWTTEDVAARMSDRRQYSERLLCIDLLMVACNDDRIRTSDETLNELAAVFDVSVEYLRNLDATWRAYPDRRSPFVAPESIYGNHEWVRP